MLGNPANRGTQGGCLPPCDGTVAPFFILNSLSAAFILATTVGFVRIMRRRRIISF